MSPSRYVTPLEAEEIVLLHLEHFKCGVTSSQLDNYIHDKSGEWMPGAIVSSSLERCCEKGEAERDGQSIWFYRITDKGRARLAGGQA